MIIRFGLIRTTIPLQEIVEVMATKSWMRMAWNKVWSLDRLLICRSGELFPVAISPENKQGFLDELMKVLPNLKVVIE